MQDQSSDRITVHSVDKHPLDPVFYTCQGLGIDELGGTGRGVKVCIIDSGLPSHPVVAKNTADFVSFVNFCEDDAKPSDLKIAATDNLGHATLIAGLVAGHGHDYVGIAPDASLLFAQVFDEKLRVDACIASILWAVIKEVDIIVSPLCTAVDHPALRDAIQKAHKNNICIISPVGTKRDELPVKYPEILSVGGLDENNKLAGFSLSGNLNLPCHKKPILISEERYGVATGVSIAAGLAAGIAARTIEAFKSAGKAYTVTDVYDKLKLLSRN